MSVIHIVMFKYKSSASTEAVQNVRIRERLALIATANPEFYQQACSEMLALKSSCLHPTTQTAYIKSLTGGLNNSPENLAVSGRL